MFAAERVSHVVGLSRGAALTEPGLGACWEHWWQESCRLSQTRDHPTLLSVPAG